MTCEQLLEEAHQQLFNRQCCHYFFFTGVQSSSIFFFFVARALTVCQFPQLFIGLCPVNVYL